MAHGCKSEACLGNRRKRWLHSESPRRHCIQSYRKTGSLRFSSGRTLDSDGGREVPGLGIRSLGSHRQGTGFVVGDKEGLCAWRLCGGVVSFTALNYPYT